MCPPEILMDDRVAGSCSPPLTVVYSLLADFGEDSAAANARPIAGAVSTVATRTPNISWTGKSSIGAAASTVASAAAGLARLLAGRAPDAAQSEATRYAVPAPSTHALSSVSGWAPTTRNIAAGMTNHADATASIDRPRRSLAVGNPRPEPHHTARAKMTTVDSAHETAPGTAHPIPLGVTP